MTEVKKMSSLAEAKMSKLAEAIAEFDKTFLPKPEPETPKVNWFDIYVKKEKEFIKSIRDIDAKMNLIIRTLGEVEQRLLSKMEYLEHRIDSLNE